MQRDGEILVQKFGGTSLATIERIRASAGRVADAYQRGLRPVVIVSAMAGETDRLLDLGAELGSGTADARLRELDSLVSTGEQVSAALMALALQEKGVPGRSFTAHQVGIRTDDRFQQARIREIESAELMQALDAGFAAVVTGFQGVDDSGNLLTLGRGGSDTTAVAFAAVLGAPTCVIYTDVEGVFTADPNVCPQARKLDTIACEEMLELASVGAKVLQIRSVEMAMKHDVEIHVRSSFTQAEGTRVVPDKQDLEALAVTGVAHVDKQAKVTVVGLENRADLLARIFQPLADGGISVDLITHNVTADGRMTVTFTIDEGHLQQATESIETAATELGARDTVVERDATKVSVVGIGMRTRAGVAQKVFSVLSEAGIPILLGLSTEIKVSCLIPSASRDKAVTTLHDAFGLGR